MAVNRSAPCSVRRRAGPPGGARARYGSAAGEIRVGLGAAGAVVAAAVDHMAGQRPDEQTGVAPAGVAGHGDLGLRIGDGEDVDAALDRVAGAVGDPAGRVAVAGEDVAGDRVRVGAGETAPAPGAGRSSSALQEPPPDGVRRRTARQVAPGERPRWSGGPARQLTATGRLAVVRWPGGRRGARRRGCRGCRRRWWWGRRRPGGGRRAGLRRCGRGRRGRSGVRGWRWRSGAPRPG